MSLSVCLLTRNQETDLPRALRSVAGLAEEILVADTGSTDGTARIATEFGAKLVQFPWNDDFAAGRNFTVAQATSDWVLWLNADEEMLPTSHGHTRECLTRDDVFGYFVVLQNVMEAGWPDAFMETSDLRLFRRRPDLRFVGRCHPACDPALVEAVRREGKQVLPSAVTLRSTALLTERTETKLRWNAHLLELELRDHPGQLRYLIEYGRTLLLLKDPKAQAVLAEAATQVAAARNAPAAPSTKVQVLLEYLLTVSADLTPGGLSRTQAITLALRWFPASPPLLYKIAELAFQQQDFRRAAGLLERLVQLGQTATYDRSRPFDPGLIGDDAVLNLGACYRQLGELVRAEQCYRQLLPSRHFSVQAAQGLAAVQQALMHQRGAFSFDSTGGPLP